MQNSNQLQQALVVLQAGGVVLHATEGVWGLACDPGDEQAVAKVLSIKSREVSKGLILIGADAEQFDRELSELSAPERAEVEASWPGAVTWVLPNVRFAKWVCGEHSTVAVRVPGHCQARALCEAFGGPLVSTSANKAGDAAATTEADAVAAVGADVDFVVPGVTAGATGPSIIRQLDGARLR